MQNRIDMARAQAEMDLHNNSEDLDDAEILENLSEEK